MARPEVLLAHLRDEEQAALDRLFALLAIPSVSADPDYNEGMQHGAAWVAETLRDCGLSADVVETAGHPIVFATTPDDVLAPGGSEAPHILFYGHYDVQPADPVEKWTSPPFQATIRDGEIYARGAVDDKGQVMTFVEAIRAWHRTNDGKMPCRISVVIEGEEEVGSPNMQPFLEQHADQLKQADICIICDTGMLDEQTVGITTSLRGLLYFELKLIGPDRDLHSGMFGGTINNPANALVRVMAQLWDEHNRISIPGFYDDVLRLTEEERCALADSPIDADKALGEVGVQEPFGEEGFTTIERRAVRPACDINGLFGGYQKPGSKTVIPSEAGCKVSFRLAPSQDPVEVAAAFREWLEDHKPAGCRWDITEFPGHAHPVVLPSDSQFVKASHRACEATTGRPAALLREGATIPLVGDLKTTLGLDSLMIGFGLKGDNLHSPNEHFGVERFHLGCRTLAILLHELAQLRL